MGASEEWLAIYHAAGPALPLPWRRGNRELSDVLAHGTKDEGATPGRFATRAPRVPRGGFSTRVTSNPFGCKRLSNSSRCCAAAAVNARLLDDVGSTLQPQGQGPPPPLWSTGPTTGRRRSVSSCPRPRLRATHSTSCAATRVITRTDLIDYRALLDDRSICAHRDLKVSASTSRPSARYWTVSAVREALRAVERAGRIKRLSGVLSARDPVGF